MGAGVRGWRQRLEAARAEFRRYQDTERREAEIELSRRHVEVLSAENALNAEQAKLTILERHFGIGHGTY
jgi:hypothetical protein